MVTTTLRHPLELIEAFEHNTDPETKITTKTTKRQLKSITKTLKEKIDRMQIIFSTSLQMYDIKNEEKDKLESEFRKTRRRICLAHLDSTFKERYEDEFEDIKGSGDFYILVNQIIAEPNKDEEARET